MSSSHCELEKDVSRDINAFFETHSELHEAWLRELHRRAELSFAEYETSQYVVSTLEKHAPSLEVSRPFEKAPTAVLAVYNPETESSEPILLRADMDALPITGPKLTPPRLHDDVHHGCGHDGHTACLLSTGHYLHASSNAKRQVVLLFQPAEERGGGAARLLENGLLTLHSRVASVFALHCWPGQPIGLVALGEGAIMAGSGKFAIRVRGSGGHAATPGPERSEPLLAACAIVTSGQAIVARLTAAVESAVVAFTRVENVGTSGDNVSPAEVVVRGTLRALDMRVRDETRKGLVRLVQGIAAGYGCDAVCSFSRGYPVTCNSADGVVDARGAAQRAGLVVREVGFGPGMLRPSLCAEDFSELLLRRGGAYVWIGNGESSAQLHTADMKFQAQALGVGGRFFCELAVGASATRR